MANKIRFVQFVNDGSPATVRYDVLDQSGAATTLGATIQVPLTAAQATAFVAAVQAVVDAKVAADLAAAKAQLNNTLPT